MQSLFGGILGNVAPDDDARAGGNGRGQGGPRGREFSFNFPGGGQGRVVFGSFNGRTGQAGPFEPIQAGGLDASVYHQGILPPADKPFSFFPGFAAPPQGPGGRQLGGMHGSDDPMGGTDLVRSTCVKPPWLSFYLDTGTYANRLPRRNDAA